MAWLLHSGAILVLILLLLGVEAVTLWLYYRRTGQGIAPHILLLTLGSGASLVLASLAILFSWPLAVIALLLLLALLVHMADLASRWKTEGRRSNTVVVWPDVV